MKYKGFEVPKHLEPYFEDAIATVHVAEVVHTHENNRLRAARELADYLEVRIFNLTNQQVDDWMMFNLGLERAHNAYRKVKNEEQAEIQRQEWVRDNTCPYCKTVVLLQTRPDALGRSCQDCRDAYEALRVDKLKTAARLKALNEVLNNA